MSVSATTTYSIRNSIPTANSSTPLNPTESTSQSLPVGAIVGIVLGVVALLILIGLSLFFWLRARRQKRLYLAQKQIVRQSVLDYGACYISIR